MADAPKQYDHLRTTLSKLERYHSEGKCVDVKLRVDTKVFNTQRWLLTMNSEYFDTMFSKKSNTTHDEPKESNGTTKDEPKESKGTTKDESEESDTPKAEPKESKGTPKDEHEEFNTTNDEPEEFNTPKDELEESNGTTKDEPKESKGTTKDEYEESDTPKDEPKESYGTTKDEYEESDTPKDEPKESKGTTKDKSEESDTPKDEHEESNTMKYESDESNIPKDGLEESNGTTKNEPKESNKPKDEPEESKGTTKDESEESDTTNDEPITLSGMDASAFGELLHFMYSGDIYVTDSNVLPLLRMNEDLQLCTGHIKEQCLLYVKRRSREEEPIKDALDLLSFAHSKGENDLAGTLRIHICRHLYHYSKDAQLIEFSFEILNELLQFSKDYILPLHGSANVLLMIVHNWNDHNRQGRGQYYNNLMENVNFLNVSSNFSQILINRLENALNEVANLFKDVKSHSDLLEKFKRIDSNLIDGDHQFDGIITFRIEKVSEMQTDMRTRVYSPSRTISDLSWKIAFKREKDKVSMTLHCDGTNLMPHWNCYASGVFTIVSHNGQDNCIRKLKRRLFTSNKKTAGYGPVSGLKWNDLMDSANGYLDDDGSITLNAHVYADVPFLQMT